MLVVKDERTDWMDFAENDIGSQVPSAQAAGVRL